jgi:hypothetical protein
MHDYTAYVVSDLQGNNHGPFLKYQDALEFHREYFLSQQGATVVPVSLTLEEYDDLRGIEVLQ